MKIFRSLFVLAYLSFHVSAQQPANVDRLLQRAHEASENNHAEDAIEAYRQAIKLAPASVTPHNNLGLLFFNAGRYEEALVELQQAHKLQPGQIQVKALLGMTYASLNRPSDAIPLLEEAARVAKPDAQVESLLADLLIEQKEYRRAADHLERLAAHADGPDVQYKLQFCYVNLARLAATRLVESAPDSYYAHTLRGEALSQRGNYRAAFPELQRALALAPDQRGAHLRLGDAYWQTGAWKNAESEFSAELLHTPDDCYANYKLANTRMQLQAASDDILPFLEKAVKRCPELTQAIVDRGITYLKVGRNAEAATDLELAEKRDPQEPTIHFQLAKAYSALERHEDSAREMRAFAALEQAARQSQPATEQHQ